MPVIHINVSSMVAIMSAIIVIYLQTAQSFDPPVTVIDIYISNLGHPPIIIIVDRYILYLDYGSVIVILYKRVVIKTRVKGYIGMSKINIGIYPDPIFHIKIELAIREN